MGPGRRVLSSGMRISQTTAVSNQLWDPLRKQKPHLSPVSLFNSLFIVTSKSTEVKIQCMKLLWQALPFKPIVQPMNMVPWTKLLGFISEFIVYKKQPNKKYRLQCQSFPSLEMPKVSLVCAHHLIIPLERTKTMTKVTKTTLPLMCSVSPILWRTHNDK